MINHVNSRHRPTPLQILQLPDTYIEIYSYTSYILKYILSVKDKREGGIELTSKFSVRNIAISDSIGTGTFLVVTELYTAITIKYTDCGKYSKEFSFVFMTSFEIKIYFERIQSAEAKGLVKFLIYMTQNKT